MKCFYGKKMELRVFTDGGARGNPGPAAVGFLVQKEGKTVKRFAQYIGETTNNVAEYTAVIKALEWLVANSKWRIDKIVFFLDSKLVASQLNGLYKIKDYKLRNLVVKARELEREIGGNVCYRHIPREKNREADSLVNSVLDKL